MNFEFNSEDNTMTVNGIRISFELLAALTNPDESVVHSFRRRGNKVTVTTHVSLTEYTPEGMIH